MEVRRYVRALRRSLWLIVGCVVLVVAAAAAFSLTRDDVYESKARVIVSSAQEEITQAYAGGLLSEQRAATYSELVSSGLMAQNVQERAGVDLTISELTENIQATAVEDSQVLELRFTAGDPNLAQLVTQTYADELVDVAAEIEEPTGGGDAPTKITVIDPASLQESRISPQPVRDVILAIILGLVLGVGLALLRELLNTRIGSTDELQDVTDTPILGHIANEGNISRSRLITDLEHHAPRVEAFRVLRTNVQFLDVDAEHKMLLITSSLPQEGKTSTAVNLALTLARAGTRTLLVDCDLRRPQIAGIFDIDDAAGVTTVLLGKVGIEDAVWTHPESGLHVLGSGIAPPNAAELLQTQAMANLLARLRASYDVVILDTPPLLPVTDAAVLSTRADSTLLVVRHGKTKREQLASAIDRLTQVDTVASGIVLNAVPSSATRFGYYYGYVGGYSSYRPASADKKRRGRKAKRRSRKPAPLPAADLSVGDGS